MTGKQLAKYIGRPGWVTYSGINYNADSIRFPITVTDSRTMFGRTDLLVEPVGGSGSAWVELARVTFPDARKVAKPCA